MICWRLGTYLPLLFPAILLGCGGPPPADIPQMPLIPISGRVLVDGQPAPGARVTLYPVDIAALGVVTPRGEADADGRFQVTTYAPHDGAPAGEYRAAVSWCDVLNPGASDPELGPEKLPPRYQHPDMSGLQVRVQPDAAELPSLELSRRR